MSFLSAHKGKKKISSFLAVARYWKGMRKQTDRADKQKVAFRRI